MNLILKNTILFFGLALLFSCGQNQIQKIPAPVVNATSLVETNKDTLTLTQVFENLSQNPDFVNKMGLDDEYAEMEEIYYERTFGDINNDDITDAIIPYVVQGRGGGNNWTTHYAIFLGQKENMWNYVGLFNAGGSASNFYVVLDEIKNGKIFGYHAPERNNDYEINRVPVEYSYQEGNLVKTYLKLHYPAESNNDYLSVEEIQTSDNQIIPARALLRDYQAILGEIKPDWGEEEPEECGTYYDYDDLLGFVSFPFITLEVNKAEEAIVSFIILKDNGYKVQTNRGTLTAETTLNEILSIFGDGMEINRSDSDKNEIVDLRIPIEKNNTKDVWVLYFNKENRALETVSLLMGCK